MRNFSPEFNRNILSISPNDPLLFLLEITHPQLLEPIRLVRDKVDYQYAGHNWIATPFSLALFPDEEKQIPKANLLVANVGRELVNWIEQSEGGFGARVKILILVKGSPAQFEIDSTVQTILVNQTTVNVEVGFEDILNKPMVQKLYDQFEAPGLL